MNKNFYLFLFVNIISTQTTFAASATSAEIAELYRAELGREQDESGATFWKNSGLSVEEIRDQFRRSDEYKNKSASQPATPKQVVTETSVPATNEDIKSFYIDILGREADDLC